jgi:hypothetical protein
MIGSSRLGISSHEREVGISDFDNRVQVFGLQPHFPGNLYEKSGTNFLVVMKGKRIAGPAGSFQSTMRPVLPCDCPSDSDQCGQEFFAFTEGQRLMRRRRPSQIMAGLPPRARCSRRPHAMPAPERLKSPPRESGHRPSLRAWTRPTNGRRLLAPGQWGSIPARLFPSILRPLSRHYSLPECRRRPAFE